jgi:hypothetical protein
MPIERRDLDEEATLHETKRASQPTLKINTMIVMVVMMMMMITIMIIIKF